MVVHRDAAGRPGAQTPARPTWETVDWRAHQRWVLVDGRPINTIELGEGEPALVFVHGLSGCWPNWMQQLAAFAGERRVVAMDLPGFGHSPGHAGEVSMPGYAAILQRLLSELGLERVVLVGNSMGGLIAAELAAAAPALVDRLVLVSPAGLSTYENRLVTRTMPAIRRLQQMLALGAAWTASHSDAIAARPRARRLVLEGVVAHPERIPGPLAAEQLRGAGTDGFLSALEAIVEYDLEPRLGQIECPALVVWGTKDRLVTVRDAPRFTAAIPNASEVVYEDTGHMAMLERPAEFNELLAWFIAEQAPGAGGTVSA
jgi:pimeloyl-ACP methyl ester carboxylesterase